MQDNVKNSKITISQFHVVVFQRTPNKYTKIYNARVEPLYCLLNPLLVTSLIPLPLWGAKNPFYPSGNLSVNQRQLVER